MVITDHKNCYIFNIVGVHYFGSPGRKMFFLRNNSRRQKTFIKTVSLLWTKKFNKIDANKLFE